MCRSFSFYCIIVPVVVILNICSSGFSLFFHFFSGIPMRQMTNLVKGIFQSFNLLFIFSISSSVFISKICIQFYLSVYYCSLQRCLVLCLPYPFFFSFKNCRFYTHNISVFFFLIYLFILGSRQCSGYFLFYYFLYIEK